MISDMEGESSKHTPALTRSPCSAHFLNESMNLKKGIKPEIDNKQSQVTKVLVEVCGLLVPRGRLVYIASNPLHSLSNTERSVSGPGHPWSTGALLPSEISNGAICSVQWAHSCVSGSPSGGELRKSC